MELEYVKLISAFGLLLITFLFTMLPVFWFKKYEMLDDNLRQDNFRGISYFTCFGGGVFLGTCLLHLFPDVQQEMNLIFKDLNIVPNYPVSEFLFGFGFLAILIIEQIILNCREQDEDDDDEEEFLVQTQEQSTNDSTFQDNNTYYPTTQYGSIGVTPEACDEEVTYIQNRSSSSIFRSLLLVFALSLHSIFEGLAIGLQTSIQSNIRILVAVLIHKCIIAFTLGLNLTHSSLRNINVIKSNFFFSLASPIGIVIGVLVIDFVEGVALAITSGILQGLATGTFLYITVIEILPKELSTGKDRMVKMACVVLGYSIVSLLLTFLPE
ncbi:zinc transporter ZIP1 [Trichonephila inaurata madagascariensis]|uniref:Zinc transporter ZIP1 n=1 Tax=Trichonephila inaurata madagascariensis TaxID=2747483 RepID=A0A8X6YP48_9ARAC|nr:zinc transporter ZIP1 [Trichonephila inaurata madagascariensis]